MRHNIDVKLVTLFSKNMIFHTLLLIELNYVTIHNLHYHQFDLPFANISFSFLV